MKRLRWLNASLTLNRRIVVSSSRIVCYTSDVKTTICGFSVMFIGRDSELEKLYAFKQRRTAGLVVVSGRRRVGKSTLIEHFSESSRFLEFYGLAPREGLSNADQLAHFGKLMGKAFDIPSMIFTDWFQAFDTLAGLTTEGEYIILLDEISWMAAYDKDLPGILKGIWDTKLKKNNQLILFLCGSVSSWIEENILEDKAYVGRVSLQMQIEEMPLYDANAFWQDNPYVSAFEKFKLLCVTGGIPRYLEEINTNETAEQNIQRLAYTKEGILFKEFDVIFKDIFGKKAEYYKKVVRALVPGNLEQSEVASKLNIEPTGTFAKQLKALESAGFIRREYVWNLKGQKTNLSKYRLRDNYLRFYLKYIEPKKNLIEQNLYDTGHIENLPEWNTIMGLQFENLVLNNLKVIIEKLNITPETLISAAPFYQNKTARQQAVQIDLLIHTQYTVYVCEIKFRKQISNSIIKDMITKIEKLKIPSHLSVRPVLIYQGELSKQIPKSNYFSHLLCFEDLLNEKNFS